MTFVLGWKEGANHEASHVPRKIGLSHAETCRTVLESEAVMTAINEEAGKTGVSVEDVADKAKEILERMVATIDYKTVRKVGWLMRKVGTEHSGHFVVVLISC